jgi:hypothetical protein
MVPDIDPAGNLFGGAGRGENGIEPFADNEIGPKMILPLYR